MPLFNFEKEVEHLCKLQTLVPRPKEQVGIKRGYDLVVCRLERPHDGVYFKKDVSDWWFEVSFESVQ